MCAGGLASLHTYIQRLLIQTGNETNSPTLLLLSLAISGTTLLSFDYISTLKPSVIEGLTVYFWPFFLQHIKHISPGKANAHPYRLAFRFQRLLLTAVVDASTDFFLCVCVYLCFLPRSHELGDLSVNPTGSSSNTCLSLLIHTLCTLAFCEKTPL